LSAAEYLSGAFAADEDEVVEVIASHYLSAHEAAPDAEGATEIRGKAQAMLARAGERAASLAAAAEARRYVERAAELTHDGAERAELALDISEAHAYPEALTIALRAKAGIALSRGHSEESRALLERAVEIALDSDLGREAGNCYFNLSDRCFRRDEYADALGY